MGFCLGGGEGKKGIPRSVVNNRERGDFESERKKRLSVYLFQKWT